ncbi:MAG: GntR family transcriptional regulator [Planctomycetota bacterium]
MARLRIDTRSATPLYEQIVEQVRQSVVEGRLRPGDRLPSIRELALELKVNRNTVAHAYEQLRNLRLIETGGPKGAFVAESAAADRGERAHRLEQRIQTLGEELTRLGFSPQEIAEAVEQWANQPSQRGDA